MTRRSFTTVLGSALATAAGAARVQGANDRIRVGLIGCGGRGRYLMRKMSGIPGVEFSAVSDLYSTALDQGRQAAAPGAQAYGEYRRILDRKDIDAVVVATQNHWHAPITIDALLAGKDVYVEKPLTHTIDEGKAVIAAAQRYNRITQVGTQRRSSAIHLKARDMVAAGQVGKVALARVEWFRNSTDPPYRFPIPADLSPSTVDWKTYLKPTRQRDFDPHRFIDWYCYWDYCEGIAEDLAVHSLDSAHMVLGLKAPTRVTADGDILFWRDGREVPDTLTAVFHYAEGVQIQFTATFSNGHEHNRAIYYGNRGTIEIEDLDSLHLYPEDGKDSASPPSLTVTKEELGIKDTTLPHMQNFYDCVRSRKPANCPVEIGDQGAVCSHLATLAQRERRFVYWDSAQRRVS